MPPRQSFPVADNHDVLAGIKLYCLVTEAHVCVWVCANILSRVVRPTVPKFANNCAYGSRAVSCTFCERRRPTFKFITKRPRFICAIVWSLISTFSETDDRDWRNRTDDTRLRDSDAFAIVTRVHSSVTQPDVSRIKPLPMHRDLVVNSNKQRLVGDFINTSRAVTIARNVNSNRWRTGTLRYAMTTSLCTSWSFEPG